MGDSHEEEVEEQGEGRMEDGCPILHASNPLCFPHPLKKIEPVTP